MPGEAHTELHAFEELDSTEVPGSHEGMYMSAARLVPALRPVDGALFAPVAGLRLKE
jgi:hypothetical protein